jgi:type IV secretory pathway TraG/TraD family ATPase VirD4
MVFAPDDRVTYIGRTNHRNSDRLFGIRQADRRMHMLVTGKTGTGKTHLLKLLIQQDLRAGSGVSLFDPHGDLARDTRTLVPPDRRTDLIYVDPADSASPWRFNPFANVSVEHRSLAANGIVEVFKKLWRDDWGPRLEHLLRNVAFALLETEGASFADVPRLLTDHTARLEIARGVTNPAVREFWSNEFDKMPPAFRATMISPLQNKVGVLLTDPVTRRFFTEAGASLDLRRLMDDQRILIVNLDKGRLGEGSASVIGSLLLSHMMLAGMSRSDVPETERPDFAAFLDEFQTFTSEALANMLSELRKFRVPMVLSTQYLAAIDPPIRDAVLGNAATIIVFRLGADDAARMAREMGEPVSGNDITGLPKHHVYIRLLIDGTPSRAFSATIPSSILSGERSRFDP